jgi:hypothetical protein
VQRATIIAGRSDATVEVREAGTVLRDIGLNARTLLKIDIEGAEYAVVPAIADLLRDAKPYLHISFHPFNIVVGTDDYVNAITRLRMALQIAEAIACYRYMYFYTQGRWINFEAVERMDLLRHYLLCPKPIPRVATPEYGFTEALALSDTMLPLSELAPPEPGAMP